MLKVNVGTYQYQLSRATCYYTKILLSEKYNEHQKRFKFWCQAKLNTIQYSVITLSI